MAETSSSMRSGANSMAFQIIQQSELKDRTKIGAGGFGIVYKYKHDSLGNVAVKKCRLNSQLEVDSLAKPGLNNFTVKILGWIEPTDADIHSYIVMEYMEYGSLKDFSRKLRPIPDSLKIRMVSEVIEGMHFLHDKNIIHRDLKLENIFVGKEFSVKIGDLGCATWKSVANLTKDTPGTFTHMAPEILKNVNEPATKMSDVYSFGITLWELSTYGDPFENAQNSKHVKVAVLEGHRPASIQEDVPRIIKDMMERAWHQAPDKRPTFQELKEEIAQEYNDNYKEDVPAALSLCYTKLSLAQKKEEESCKENGDTPDSPSAEDNLSMLDGPRLGPLCSYNIQRNGGVLEKISVPVSDTGKGELPGVTTAFGKLGIVEGREAVQPVSDNMKASCQPLESASAPLLTAGEPRIPTQESHLGNPETSKNFSFPNHPQSQHQTGYNPQLSNPSTQQGSWGRQGPWPPQQGPWGHQGPWPPQQGPWGQQGPWAAQQGSWGQQGIPHQTSNNSSFPNQSQNQYQTGYNPQTSSPFTQQGSWGPQGPWGQQGFNLNVSGDGHNIVFGGSGTTVTINRHENTGGKGAGRGDDSSASKSSESDILDPEVQKTMNSKEILEEKHINTLSGHIGLRWKELGRELKLSSVKMENIEVDHHYEGQREWAFQVMLAWMRKKGRATKGELATALVAVELTEVALKLR
ncbi:uncharacterized protein [Asterias amurensis]|uniref:uncharacterized protein n=1 Tax=Asterias amurensis TaxID=7602 RepID=UPI003AB35E2D